MLCAGAKDSLLLLFASRDDALGSLRWKRVRFPRLKGKKKEKNRIVVKWRIYRFVEQIFWDGFLSIDSSRS